MANSDQRFVATGKWYDVDRNLDELHEDLRQHPSQVQRVASKRPSVRRHMESCSTCLAIIGSIRLAPNPLSTRKRLKLALTKERMHQALKLPENFEIVHMYADNDPNVVFILVAGASLPEVDEQDETPIGELAAATDSGDGPHHV